MPNSKKDLLFDLICSLTKAEKRIFRIYAKKIQQRGNVLFLQLFDYLEKQEAFEVQTLLNDLPNIKSKQIPNLKRNLYEHILASLRLLYSDQKVALQIRKFIDYAEILYSKGLYLQALKILSRAKKVARKNHQDDLHLEIVEFEKTIESRHITRSSTERMAGLIAEADFRKDVNANISELSNLKLHLQRIFIDQGHVSGKPQLDQIQQDFSRKINKWQESEMTFFEKVYFYQSCYWFHYLRQDFEVCFQHAEEWVKLYKDYANWTEKSIDMYLIGMHHLLNMAFFTKKETRQYQLLINYEDFILEYESGFSVNTTITSKLFGFQAHFNRSFLSGEFSQGLKIIPKVKAFLKTFQGQLDNYKVMILHYKIAAIYFCAEQPGAAIDHLNFIVNYHDQSLREDIIIYARLLLILAHLEQGNENILEYLINSTSRLLAKATQPDQLSVATLNFFKKLIKTEILSRPALFQAFQNDLNALASQDSERRSFVFLDVRLWLTSKISRKPIGQLILEPDFK